jgi:excinuclease UvrABC nuclease subunit
MNFNQMQLIQPTQEWQIIHISNFEDLPDRSGVYVNLKPKGDPSPFSLLYTGKTKSLLQRWSGGHHNAIRILLEGGTHIGYLCVGSRQASIYESEIIRLWDPPLNRKLGVKWDNTMSRFERLKVVAMQLPGLQEMFCLSEIERIKAEDRLHQWEVDIETD